MRKHLNKLFLFVSMITMYGCQKFLEAKSDQSLAIPNTLQDYQALMENFSKFSTEPKAGEISSDDFYLTVEDWESLASDGDKRTYVWEKDYLFDSGINDWKGFSDAVYYCNTVIEGLGDFDQGQNNLNMSEYYHILAQAHYFRGKRLLQASFIWCEAYDIESSNMDLGLPLRLDTDFNKTSVRASLHETFETIIKDLSFAAQHLPIKPINVARPSKPAAYGVLARTYLYMRDYDKAMSYADSCLQLRDGLLDFNELDPTLMLPIPAANTEVISENGIPTGQILNLTRARVDSSLYNQYENNDLRKSIYFTENPDGSYNFRGRMNQEGLSLFAGISTSEMYFIRMECQARNGMNKEAWKDLNYLLKQRYKAGKFSPLTFDMFSESPLQTILLEKRKELLFRGVRWPDIKRLNKEGANIKIKRILGDEVYELQPNDLRYALPIPEEVINISGMQQNPR